MNYIVLDSSTKTLYVGLICDNEIKYERYIEGRNDHAKHIVDVLNEALISANIEAKDLDKIVIGYGPGSYTGVRMSVTIGKMLASFLHKDLYAISSLVLMASKTKGLCKVSIDARRGNAFSMVLNTTTDEIVLEEGLHSYEELDSYSTEFTITEDEFQVDPVYCLNHAKKIDEPHLFVPNYLRDTEAERNLV